MHDLFRLIDRFRSDERGVFAALFGLMAIVLIAMAGAVVDFVSLQQARTRAQVALDAATLALQPEIFKAGVSNESIRARAEALLVERINDTRIGARVDGITTNQTDGSLFLHARLEVPTIFVQLVGVSQLNASLSAEATRKKLALEVVMVLDNSGSMDTGNRMGHLKTAASCATNILFMGACNPPGNAVPDENVMVGVVPFTSLVNVGAQHANQPWVDRTGRAPKSNDNFDNDDDASTPFTGNVDRIALYGQLNNVNWRGCFEARVYPHSVSDTPPNPNNPATLFTPVFAPDEPGAAGETRSGFFNSYLPDDPPSCDRPAATGASCFVRERATQCNANRNNASCTTTATGTPSGPQYRVVGGIYVGRLPPSCDCRSGTWSSWTQTAGSGNNRTFERTRSCNGFIPTGLSDREYQERLCKYTGNIRIFTDANAFFRGPNADCPSAPILALTQNRGAVLNAISAMRSEGGTNIHQGAIWGFHTLSPSAPFTEAGPYDEATAKVMILMTDGENTFYTRSNINNAYFLQAYGYPYNRREGNMNSTDASMAARMDQLLIETCNNAKAQGIAIYTIGLAVPNNTVRQLLRNCATEPEDAYFPNAPSELVAVFSSIASQLAQLRLAQ